jgi:antagonist of KipI
MKVIKKGVLSTFQDLGRANSRSKGVNVGGAMDAYSFKLLNLILQNTENETAIEMHFPAPVFEFEETCVFAISGADFGCLLNGKEILHLKQYGAQKGDVLSFSKWTFGQRCYLGVKGGFDLPKWQNSAATNLQIGFQKMESAILLNKRDSRKNSNLGIFRNDSFFRKIIRIVLAESISNDSLEAVFCKNNFVIQNESNRMGYKLSGPSLSFLNLKEKISFGVGFGSIQCLPNGQLIILMADSQTTGGYPVIGFVAQADLPYLAQMGPSQSFYFEIITLDQAFDLINDQNLFLKQVEASLKINVK